MTLDKDDLKEIAKIIRKEVKKAVIDAMTVEWTLEKHRDEKTGMPLAKPELLKEKVYIPSAFIQLLAFYEGAQRGLQEQVCKEFPKLDMINNNLQTMAQILIQSEQSLKCLAALSDRIKDKNLLEDNNGKSNSTN
jgi:hypothetical protein